MSALWPNGKKNPGDVWHEFGPRKPIWTPNGPTSSFHSGIDIGPWDGSGSTWLLAPDDGIVSHAGYDSIFGNRVVVTTWYGNDKVEFWLCHGRARSLQVKVGQRVRQGQRLQLMGETGKASGVHIHYEIHVNGVRVDPRDFYARPASGGGGRPASGGGSASKPTTSSKLDQLFQEEEMPLSFINVQGKAKSHQAGLFAVMRSNSGVLFAKRVTTGSTDPKYPTIPHTQLADWQKTMVFYELTD